MSFDDFYECCFKNIGVVRICDQSKNKVKDDGANILTLDTVFASSRYVIFYVISSKNCGSLDMVDSLKRFVRDRNADSASSMKESPAKLRRFFGVNKKHKKKRLIEVANVAMIVFDINAHDEQPQTVVGDNGWYVLVPINPIAKSRLLRSLQYHLPPSLIVLDASSKQIITADGRRLLQEDLNGKNFPWLSPNPNDLFRGVVLRNCKEADGTKRMVEEDFKNLSPTVKGLYFGANWCPPCRTFTKQLITCYHSLKAAGVPFEIFFCSSDRSQESFEQHFSTMPWQAFPYDRHLLGMFTRLYSVNGIPAFLILDEDHRLITRHGRNVMVGDPHGKLFPWGPQPMYELNEHTLCRLRDEPSLVLFTEGTPDDVAFSIEVLRPTSESLFFERRGFSKRLSYKEDDSCEISSSTNNCNHLAYSTNSVNSSISSDASIPSWADPVQIFYTGDDPLCDMVLEGIGLGNIDLPVIVIVDAIIGGMYICEKPDVSAEIVAEFIANYKSGKLKFVSLPSTCQGKMAPLQVGGIPIRAIHQALGMGNSPSQISIGNENTSHQIVDNTSTHLLIG